MRRQKDDRIRQFVEAWGAMGALWGINRSVARVHALLMASDGPLSLDEISERLDISKGNVSMSLRELRTFGVIRQVEGTERDRRDYYVTEPDVWTMFFRILKERKRREFDPAIETLHRVLDEPGERGPAYDRLAQMAELMGTVDSVVERFLKDPGTSRTALGVIAALPFAPKPRGRTRPPRT